MRNLLLILSLLLSLLCGSRDDVAQIQPRAENAMEICQEQSRPAQDPALNRDICLTATSTSTFAGGGQGGPVSVRTTNSTHRTNSSTKSTTRMLKSGKDLCLSHFKLFLDAAPLTESGRLCSERYLFSICRLRL